MSIRLDVVKILMILMLIDSILGIIKSMRLGDKFSFKTLTWGIVTKLSILIVPMILALMGKALDYDFKVFVTLVINIIIVSEGVSSITNILSIKSKKNIENADYMTMLLQAIKRFMSSVIKRMLKGFEIESKKGNSKK